MWRRPGVRPRLWIVLPMLFVTLLQRGPAQPSPAQPSPAQHQCLTSVIAVGTTGIILQAPSLYDLRPAIDEYLSEIEVAVAKPRGQNNEIY